MKELSRKEREKLRRREAIIDAAEQIIGEHGFNSATMEEIAEKAELGKGTLYLHFKSKVSIYLAICERGSRLLNQEMAKVLTKDLSGLKMVENIGHVYLKFIQKNPIYFSAFNYYESILDMEEYSNSPIVEKCEENASEAMTFIVRSLQVGMQDGSIKDTIDPKELGLIIWAASKGVMHMAFMKHNVKYHKFMDEIEFSFESLIQNFIHLIGSGIEK
ncbi:TetR/AcrR family transcriptional regulator [Rhodohalobacter sp.]|uniref:TetR/AcrR family transcriptional regulator n=1 Tax=Rhodohalobacter sp. TaxID=1974210 RepID=UPI0035697491